MNTKQITNRLEKLSSWNMNDVNPAFISLSHNRIYFNSTDLETTDFEKSIPTINLRKSLSEIGIVSDEIMEYQDLFEEKNRKINQEIKQIFYKTRMFIQMKMQELANYNSELLEKAKAEKDAMV